MSRLRLLVLCSDQPQDEYLVTKLRARFDLRKVIVEPGSAQHARIRARANKKRRFWASYHALRRRLLGMDAYRRRTFDATGKALAFQPCITVLDINHTVVQDTIRSEPHDLVIVRGTSIIREHILAASPCRFINVHGGFLPFYRGNHCVFYAVKDRRWDRVGATLHFIDRGVDTGEIIAVVPPLGIDDPRRSSPEELYCAAVRGAIDRLIDVLAEQEKGSTILSSRQTSEGRQYLTSHRKPWEDVAVWIRRMLYRFTMWFHWLKVFITRTT